MKATITEKKANGDVEEMSITFKDKTGEIDKDEEVKRSPCPGPIVQCPGLYRLLTAVLGVRSRPHGSK